MVGLSEEEWLWVALDYLNEGMLATVAILFVRGSMVFCTYDLHVRMYVAQALGTQDLTEQYQFL